MNIEFRLPRGATRNWHETLRRKAVHAGHRVRVAIVDAPVFAPPGLSLLTLFESMLYRSARNGAGRLCEAPVSMDLSEVDLVIDLAGGGYAGSAMRLEPIWDGSLAEAAAIAALLDRRSPVLAVAFVDGDCSVGGVITQSVITHGVAALEEPDIFTPSFDRVCGRMGDLVLRAVQMVGTGVRGAVLDVSHGRAISAGRPLGFALSSVAAKVNARLMRLAIQTPQWRIGWRHAANDLVIDTMRWPALRYNVLRDDGKRYFADPFVMRHAGVTHVLCEEFPFATQRGILSAFIIGDDGAASEPRPVLELPYHLSYPMIFKEGDTIYMIPETSGNRTIELWRAERFPDRWTLEATLVENVVASDATLVRHGGRYWIFATISEEGQSTWDALGLFSAERLQGPWTAHPSNPVLIDAGAARPAGMMVNRGGRLLRPAQNCLTGYGAGLAICAVERLDLEGFQQKIIGSLDRRIGGAGGAHTLNAADGVEVIDFFGSMADQPGLRQARVHSD